MAPISRYLGSYHVSQLFAACGFRLAVVAVVVIGQQEL